MRTNRIDSFLTPMRMLDQLEREWAKARSEARPAGHALPVNVTTGENDATAVFELPGFDLGQIDVEIDGHEVTVTAERSDGDYEGDVLVRERRQAKLSRTVRLPFEIDRDGVAARYVDGRLHVELPRAEADKPARIAVTAG